jgi:hypothetical protein
LSGNKSAAKSFSLQAKVLNEQVSSLQGEAAELIFAERNPTLWGPKPRNTIDLHGLHAEEGVRMCAQALPHLASHFAHGRGPGGAAGSVVHLIIGMGNHTRPGAGGEEGRLGPAVMEWLRREGYSWNHGKMSDGQGGIITVYL